MGTHVPTTAPIDTTFAYWAQLVDELFITIFNDLMGFQIDASGNTAGRATYDAEAAGFVYYDSEAGLLYQKHTATSADWSDALPFTTTVQSKVYTGSYTGDGSTTQAITGVGFQPKYLKIWERETVDTTALLQWETTDTIVDDNASGGAIWDLGNQLQFKTNRIVSLDTDGFTVDDGGSDLGPNKSGDVYNYICFG